MTTFVKYGYRFLFAALPWSVGLPLGTWEVDFPAEPLMAVLGVALAVHFARNPRLLLRLLCGGPLLPLSAAWLGWMAWCAAWSSMPLVSWKYWLVEAGHWWVFAVGMARWPGLWRDLVRIFALSMGGVVVYTIAHHAQYGFRADQALLSPMPFFEEHTVYAAAVVFALVGGTGFTGSTGWPHKFYPKILLAVLLAGLGLAHCRAAWASLAAAALVAALVLTGRRYRMGWLLVAAALGAGGIFFRGEILGKTQAVAARDVSTLERLNRWSCALRMADERPVSGFGPGTFQFQYLHFQTPEQMTRISATAPVTERSPDTYGRGGGAHSEFMRALAETGWVGLGFVFIMGAFVIRMLVRMSCHSERSEASEGEAPNSNTGRTQMLRFALHDTLSPLPYALILTAFCVHGAVNDLLHDACVAAWVWGVVAALQNGLTSPPAPLRRRGEPRHTP